MTVQSLGVGVAGLFVGAFVLGRLGATLLRRRGLDSDRVARRANDPRASWVIASLAAVVAFVLVERMLVAPADVVAGPVSRAAVAAVEGVAVGATGVVALALFRRGLAAGDRLVDASASSTAADGRRRWWVAHLTSLVGTWVVLALGVRGVPPLGLFLPLLAVPLWFAILPLGWPASTRAAAVRDPTPSERDALERALEPLDRAVERILVRSGGADAPAVDLQGSACYVDESFLDAADDAALAVAVREAATVDRRRFALRYRLARVCHHEAALLVVAGVLALAVVEPTHALSRVAYDPVVLGIGAFGAFATEFVLARSIRAVVYDADRAAAAATDVETVVACVESHWTSVPVAQPRTGASVQYTHSRPTGAQRVGVLQRHATGGVGGESPSTDSGPWHLLAGWALFALAAAVSIAGRSGAVGGALPGGAWLQVLATGVAAGVAAVAGYAVCSAGVPAVLLPLVPVERPFDGPTVRREWATIAPIGVAAVVLIVAGTAGPVHWLFVPAGVLVLWYLRRAFAPRPTDVAPGWMRPPTDEERAAVERAYEAFDRAPGTVVVYRGMDEAGGLAVTAGPGSRTVWIEESLVSALDDTELAVGLAQADERGRRYWFQAGVLAPAAIGFAAFVPLGYLVSHSDEPLARPAAMAAVACILIGFAVARLARRSVYRGDAFASAAFDPETVRNVYGRRARALSQSLPPSTDSSGLVARLRQFAAPEPPWDQRIDRLDADGSSE